MSNRKLQGEIERTIKKIQEGVGDFEQMMDKFHEANSQPLKEKIEFELKKEIKKLQRLRDQIKGWIASNDVKDKSALWEHRRLVEVQMEKFKAIEKEMKTKAYSREGLSSSKFDTKDKEKLSAFQWINSCIEKLSTQLETIEAEIEALLVSSSSSTKKSVPQKPSSFTVEQMEEQVKKHRWHIDQLEIILRMIQNETLSVDKANSVKEDVEYYIDYFQEPDFLENDQIYADLNLEDGSSSELSEESSQSESESKPTSPVTLSTLSNPPVNSVQSASSKKTFLPKSPTSSIPSQQQLPVVSTQKQVSSYPKMSSSTKPNVPPFPAPSQSTTTSRPSTMPSIPLAAILSKNIEAKQTVESSIPSATISSVPLNSPWVNQKLTETLLKGKQSISEEAKKEDLISFEKLSVKDFPSPTDPIPSSQIYSFSRIRAAIKTSSVDYTKSALGYASRNVPDIYEFERNKPYAPSFPLSQHPPFYPVNPPSIFENAAIFDKFDTDTLFFIFYFQPKTIQQYLAAKELKRQSWRFHKKYLTWFQRFEEPKIVNDDFELGTYIYFDAEGSWCQRKKAEFTFEYKYLEDIELP